MNLNVQFLHFFFLNFFLLICSSARCFCIRAFNVAKTSNIQSSNAPVDIILYLSVSLTGFLNVTFQFSRFFSFLYKNLNKSFSLFVQKLFISFTEMYNHNFQRISFKNSTIFQRYDKTELLPCRIFFVF